MPDYEVTFERIGRGHRGVSKTFAATNEATLAIAIHKFALRRLASSECIVELYADGTGSLDAARFGTFTWRVA